MFASSQPGNARYVPWFMLISIALGSMVALFILAPLLRLALASSFSELSDTLFDQEVMQSIRLTLSAALAATIVGTVAGVPLAYLLARKDFFGKTVLLAVIDLPIVIPHSAAGIALLTVIGRRSFLGSLFGSEDGSLVGTSAGIAVAMGFVSIPFLVNAAREGFAAVPERLEKAARTFGASPWRVFFTISLPLAWKSILTGMIMMWARGVSEFGAVIIIAYHPMTTPVLVFQRFNDYGLAHSRAVAVLLILICVAIFVALRLVAGNRRMRRPWNA